MRCGAMGITMLASSVVMWLGSVSTWAGDVPLRLIGRVEGSGGDFIRFSSDGELILTAGDGKARVWECKPLKPVGKEMVHGSDVIYARFEDRGKIVVTGTDAVR